VFMVILQNITTAHNKSPLCIFQRHIDCWFLSPVVPLIDLCWEDPDDEPSEPWPGSEPGEEQECSLAHEYRLFLEDLEQSASCLSLSHLQRSTSVGVCKRR
jgi:hypothetical protein